MDTYYINGKFINDDEASLSVKDITVLRGYGVFDFMITYSHRPFYLEKHVARLENSANEIGLHLNHTCGEICEIVKQTVEKNPLHKESNVRIVYTGGISSDGVTPQGKGVLMVLVTPKHELPASWYTDGAAIAAVNMERFIPTAKSTNYLSAVFAQQLARKKDAIEAVYVDRQNRVLEGTTSNIFAIKNGTLVTPPDSILPGITRHVVLKLAKDRFDIELRHMDIAELMQMDEIFITASNKEIVPVIRVDETIIGNSTPGETTRSIMEAFREYTNSYGEGKE